jgi:hypothetical protein
VLVALLLLLLLRTLDVWLGQIDGCQTDLFVAFAHRYCAPRRATTMIMKVPGFERGRVPGVAPSNSDCWQLNQVGRRIDPHGSGTRRRLYRLYDLELSGSRFARHRQRAVSATCEGQADALNEFAPPRQLNRPIKLRDTPPPLASNDLSDRL